jgi:hypothetical protein
MGLLSEPRYEVLMAVTITNTVLWCVLPRSRTDKYQRFGEHSAPCLREEGCPSKILQPTSIVPVYTKPQTATFVVSGKDAMILHR